MMLDNVSPLLLFEDNVCKSVKIDRSDLYGKSRDRKITKTRHVVWYVAATYLGFSYAAVARMYNCKHTSVMYAVNKIGRDREAKTEIDSLIDHVFTKKK